MRKDVGDKKGVRGNSLSIPRIAFVACGHVRPRGRRMRQMRGLSKACNREPEFLTPEV